MSDNHETFIPPRSMTGSAVCKCGWESSAENGPARLRQADAHMYEHYAVFAQSTDDDGATWSGWGK